MRDYLKRLLSRDWTVEAVADGAAALSAIQERVPDLVLSDVMMPGLDGFQLLRALRSNPRTCSIPIILLSARAGEESSVEGLEAGADDYLVKPFSARELLARVRTHLELGKLRRGWAAKLELEVQARTSELRQTTRNLEIQIDERKRAEEALRENEERTNFALSAGRMGVWEVDFAANQLTWSDTMAPVFGVTPDKAPKTT